MNITAKKRKNLNLKNKLCVIFLIALFVPVANAQIPKDKQLHFAAGTIAGAFGYNYTYEKTNDKLKSTIAGIGLAILAGTIKETIDSRKPGNRFDPEDLTATTLGGITISITINLIKNDRRNKKIRKKRLDLLME